MKGISITKRTGGLLLAVALAAVATLALVSYVNGLEAKAYAGVETVQVYVARDTIPAGTSAEAAASNALFARTAVPRKVAAEGAVASLDEIHGKVAAVTILRGEQIVASRFSAPGAASGETLTIPDGRQAMAVEVELPPGVAGFIQPGAHVSVIGHVQASVRPGAAPEPRAEFLVQDVTVLAVGRRVVTSASGDRAQAQEEQRTADKVMLTLAVTPSQAEQLVYALFEGNVYFTLLPQGQKPSSTSGRTRSTIFS